MHGYLRLGEVSGNSENAQNLAVLLGFTKASSFTFYTSLQLLLRFANLPHKCMSLDLRLGHVSQNSMNRQYLAVLHGLLKQVRFHFYTNLQLLLRLGNLPYKYMGLDQRLGQVSWNSMNVQNLAVLLGFIKASSFLFLQRLAMYHTNTWVYTNVLLKFRRILWTFNIQLFCTVLLKKVHFPFTLISNYYYAQQIYHTDAWVQSNVWVKFRGILRTSKIQLSRTVLLTEHRFLFTLTCSYYYAQ